MRQVFTKSNTHTNTWEYIGMKGSARMLGAWQWAGVGVWSVSLSFSAGVKSSSVIKANLSLVPNGKGRQKGWGRQWEGVGEIKKKGEIKARDGYFLMKREEREVLILAQRAGLPWGGECGGWMRGCRPVRQGSTHSHGHTTHTPMLTVHLTACARCGKFAWRQEFP